MPRTPLSLQFSGRLLREERERRGLNQQALADRCTAAGYAISRGQISRYETEANKPTPTSLAGLVAGLGVEIDDLLAKSVGAA